MPPTITADVQVPPRSRTFTVDDAKQVLELLQGKPAVPAHKDEEGKDVPAVEAVEPSKNVGFGEFDKQGAARSAGVSLNKILVETLGAPHPYAITTFERDGKIVGVILNKPAKKKAEKVEPATPVNTGPDKQRRGARR